MNEGPKTYDLPVANLSQNDGIYVPRKARSQQEAGRRKQNPPNTLILEAQTDGTEILEKTFNYLADEDESCEYFARQMGGVCLNTAWYSYANLPVQAGRPAQDNVIRRRLDLPRHVRVDDEGTIHYETEVNNRYEIEGSLFRSTQLADQLETSHRGRQEKRAYQLRKQYGRSIGNIGLRLAATPLIGLRDEPYEIQTAVRNAGRDALEKSREQYDGAYPTIAQLADLDSQLSVQLRRASPTPFHDALIEATAEVQKVRTQKNAAQLT